MYIFVHACTCKLTKSHVQCVYTQNALSLNFTRLFIHSAKVLSELIIPRKHLEATTLVATREVSRALWLVAHDGLDLGLDRVVNLGDELDRAEVLEKLREVAGADDSGRDVLVGEDPGEGKLALGTAELGGQGSESLQPKRGKQKTKRSNTSKLE